MNATKLSLAVVGSLVAFALAAAPATRKQEAVAGLLSTPHSADHARIDAPAEEQPAQF